MNTYIRLFRLLEDTPSKTEIAAKKALGWDIRPEDEPGISNATRRIRVRRRKKQLSGSILSTGGTQRLRRKLGSDVFSPGTEKGAIKHMLAQKTKKSLKRLNKRYSKS